MAYALGKLKEELCQEQKLRQTAMDKRTELHARKGSCRHEQHRSVDICRGVQEEPRPRRLRGSKSVKMIYFEMQLNQQCIASTYVDKTSQACGFLVLCTVACCDLAACC